jgi:hypothetical protein
MGGAPKKCPIISFAPGKKIRAIVSERARVRERAKEREKEKEKGKEKEKERNREHKCGRLCF